jgi:hypothetical protein
MKGDRPPFPSIANLWEKPSPRPQVDGKEETHFRAGRRRSRSLHLVGRFTIGLDLGDRSTAFCVLDGDGAIVAEGKFKTTQVAIDQQLASLAPARVALDARPGWSQHNACNARTALSEFRPDRGYSAVRHFNRGFSPAH